MASRFSTIPGMRRRPAGRNLVPHPHLLLLVALPLLVHAPELSGLVSSDPNRLFFGLGDPVRQWTEGGLIPGMPGWIDGCAGVIVEALGRLVARDWVHGIVPWWNPYNGVGMPLAGEYQPAAFFLPFVLLTALPNGLLLMKVALQIVAGLSARALFRTMRVGASAALVGGIAWSFNGSFAWASDGPSEPLAFLPMLLMGIERLRHRGGPGGWGWLALGAAWMLLAGFPETTFLLGLLALGWFCVRLGQQKRQRRRFAVGVGIGGVAALLLAAPQLLAFLSYLPDAFIGSHAGANDTPLPSPAWIMQLLPYVNGPIFYGSETVWWSMGGFYGVLPVWLALFSLMQPRRRGLSLFLAAVVAAVVCKQAAVPGVTALLDLVPGMRNIFFFRYSPPVAGFALLVLAVLGLDDLCRTGAGRVRPRVIMARASIAAALVATAAAIGWRLDRALRLRLGGVSHGPLSSGQYALGSVLFGLALLGTAMVLLGRFAAGRGGMRALLCLAAIEPLILFSFPLLSCMRPPAPDRPLLAALRAHVGSDRMVTLGPLPPNVNAAYGLRSINHNGVPMPRAWIDRLRHDFGGSVDTLSFNGFSPFDAAGRPFLMPFAFSGSGLLQALGVGLLMTPHGLSPGWQQRGQGDAGAGGEVLAPGGALELDTAHWDTAGWPDGGVDRATLLVGTFLGRSDGILVVRACADGQHCVEGRGSVAAAPDNGLLQVSFEHPFTVRNGGVLHFSLRLVGARNPLMIWFRAAAWGRAPALRLLGARMPHLVYAGNNADLYRLAGAAPYLEAPGCRLEQVDLETLRSSCPVPTPLIRRELMLSGWHADVDGRRVLPRPWHGLFQSITLPAGPATVRFGFAPPGAAIALAGALLGALLAALGFAAPRRGAAAERQGGRP